jgi:hypothetical protein
MLCLPTVNSDVVVGNGKGGRNKVFLGWWQTRTNQSCDANSDRGLWCIYDKRKEKRLQTWNASYIALNATRT